MMASFDSLQRDLSDPGTVRRRGFRLAQDLCQFISGNEEETQIQELVLRALEQRDEFGSASVVIDGLAREVGLFPYLDPEKLSLSDLLAYECHRPAGLEPEIVLHHPQAVVYQTLLRGESVVLSAPTSFGKSLIIDALLASGHYKNVVIVVPTLALIDETRRRLARRFRNRYKVITHRSQQPADRNVFVLTQERVLEHEGLDEADLFVIDEFYKLDPGEDENDARALLLNQAFYQLYKRCPQFYMLGPFIQRLSDGFRTRVQCQFMIESFATVVSEIHVRNRGRDEYAALIALCRELTEPTIIYCRSPNRVAEVAQRLIAGGLGVAGREATLAADWLDATYHPDWHFGAAIRQGIGVHHGRIPRSLAQYVVRLFNEGKLPLLVCTSTLIEGVNTQAKNIIVFDNTINRTRFDLFTFNNIRGRSGRMMRHFVGRVYVFDEPPDGDLPEVDVPVISQPDNTSPTLLIQIEEGDLTPASRDRLRRFTEQLHVEYQTLRANVGIPLDEQINLAREIGADARRMHNMLCWTGIPTYPQLEFVCELIWRHFNGRRLGAGSIRSDRQLAYMIRQLYDRPRTRDLIRVMAGRSTGDANEFVMRTMDFLRLWANFHFPRLLRAIDRIQRDVFARRLPTRSLGNYEFFAARVENYFFDPAIVALDEYGIPLEIARQIEFDLQPDGDLDAVLVRLSNLNVSTLRLTPFERAIIKHNQESL